MTGLVAWLITALLVALSAGAFLFLRFTAPHDKEQP